MSKGKWALTSAFIGAGGIVVGSLITAFVPVLVPGASGGGQPSPSASLAYDSPPPPASIDIANPAPGETATICYVVGGSATLDPSTQNVAVGIHEKSENRWYFEPEVTWDSAHTNWRANVTLGDLGDKETRSYQIVALVLDKPFQDYLSSTNPEFDENGQSLHYWSSSDLPEKWIAAKDSVDVSRSGDPGKC